LSVDFVNSRQSSEEEDSEVFCLAIVVIACSGAADGSAAGDSADSATILLAMSLGRLRPGFKFSLEPYDS
jgi:hypothetical protein